MRLSAASLGVFSRLHLRGLRPPAVHSQSYTHPPTPARRPLSTTKPLRAAAAKMKRAASGLEGAKKPKKARPDVPEYHLTPSNKDAAGNDIWPAPQDQIDRAREIIRECAAAGKKTLIVPDKDADGLSSGAILQKTLILLGLDPSLIAAHLLHKGANIHDPAEREAMSSHNASYIFVLDQGSRNSPPVVTHPHAAALVIDHHHALDDDFPEGSAHVTACNSPPVATSALLTYLICLPLHKDVGETTSWLCVMGTHGDLGNTLKWEPPFPDMKATFKRYTKKALNDAVSLINAPRRTASFSVPKAWAALTAAGEPAEILKNRDLLAARAEVNAEVERCTHTAPKFSADGKIAVFRISSAAQIHPVIATRWAGHLQSAKLEVILVANEGYLPDLVNFSCRIPRSARARTGGDKVNIIETLRAIVDQSPDPTLRERLGESFARGHKEASGGIVPKQEFEELMSILEVGKKTSTKDGGGDGGSPKKKVIAKQSNTLTNYFGKKKEAAT